MRAGSILILSLTVLALTPRMNLHARISIHGEADNIASAFPEGGVIEDRARIQLKSTWSPANWLFIKASGYSEVLARSQVEDGSDINFRVHETYIEIRSRHLEVRAGYSNLVWGVLDEIQPNDVVNPIDVSRFLFEGRSEARLTVPLIRTRLYLPSDIEAEFVAVPFHERGVFDQLDEETSPFNLAARYYLAELPLREERPAKTLREVECGVRFSRTFGRIDVDLCGYRGREDFPIYSVPALRNLTFPIYSPIYLEAVADYPRFTMIGADVETVIGKWGLRWEGSWFTEDTFQHPIGYEFIDGHSYQVGVGLDRKFRDDHTLNASAVYLRRRADGDYIEPEEELSLVAGLERSFRHNREKIRVFTVYNPIERTIFLRWSGKKNLYRNFWLDLSMGIFLGDGNDLIGRFQTADFIFLRGKYYF